MPPNVQGQTQKVARVSVSDVIRMFRAFDLPVCDNAQAIKDKYNAKNGRYLKDLRNPDPEVSAHAKEWFQFATALQDEKRRAELIEVVRESFENLANATASALLSANVKTVTPEFRNSLLDLAKVNCGTDDHLAVRFAEKFMQDKGLAEGESLQPPPNPPETLGSFSATPDVGKISLSWAVPADEAEQIVVERVEIGPRGGRKTTAKQIYRGRRASFADTDVEVGKAYRYEAFASRGGAEGPRLAAEAVCMGEVKGLSAVWRGGRIHLNWKLPSPRATVCVFRRVGGSPSHRASPQGLRPGDASTEMTQLKSVEAWRDDRPEEGKNHHYRVVACFGDGLYAKGVAAECAVPRRPRPASNVKARCVFKGSRPAVKVEWTPPPGLDAGDFVVVRKDGTAPPKGADDGKEVCVANESSFEDEGVRIGGQYAYAVFVVKDGMASPGAAAPAVEVISDVLQLSAVCRDGKIVVTWKLPCPQASARIFRRVGGTPSLKPGPAGPVPGDGETTVSTPREKEEWEDEDAVEGATHYYRIVAVFPGGAASAGVDAHCRVPKRPSAATDLQASVRPGAGAPEVHLSWKPAQSQSRTRFLVVRREGSAAPASLHEGRLVKSTAAPKFVDDGVSVGKRYSYSVFPEANGMVGPAATAGPVAVLDEVRGAKAERFAGGIRLKWQAPAENASVVIFRRIGGPPEFRWGARGLECSGDDTEMIVPDKPGEWEDTRLVEGAVHRYVLVAVFGQGMAGEGVALQYRAPSRPPAPTGATAVASGRNGVHVTVGWTPPPTKEMLTYLVVVRDDGRAPSGPDDGRLVKRTSGPSCVDTKVVLGEECIYAVFSESDGLASAEGAVARVRVVAEASDARLNCHGGCIRLSWKPPSPAAKVLVFKRLGAKPEVKPGPRGPVPAGKDTEVFRPAEEGKWEDARLQEDALHCYRLVALFPSGVASQGVDLEHRVPKRPPQPPSAKAAALPGGGGKVLVEWDASPTSQHVEYVVVRREGDSAPDSPEEGKEVETTERLRCLDMKADVGHRFAYSVFPQADGFIGEPAKTAPVPVVADVRGADAELDAGKIKVKWETVGKGASVRILRKVGAEPAVKTAAHGPEPADAETELVRPKRPGEWEDDRWVEGAKHFYRIYQVFGSGLVSEGVPLLFTAPSRPPAPVGAKAARLHSGGKPEVLVEWTPSPTTQKVEYVVVRREGDNAPTSVGDGETVNTVDIPSCLDTGVVPGRRYSYGVFARSGGLLSAAAAAPPVDIAAEVSDAKAVFKGDCVQVQWRLPAPKASAVVFRRVGTPPAFVAGPRGLQPAEAETEMVSPEEPGEWRDSILHEGQIHFYRIVAVFPGNVAGEGVDCQVKVPARPPAPISPFAKQRLDADAPAVAISWQPPPVSLALKYAVVRKRGATAPSSVADGVLVAETAACSCVDTKVRAAERYSYAVFAKSGDLESAPASAGAVFVVGEVADLRVNPGSRCVELTWRTPANATVFVRRGTSRLAGHSDGEDVPVAAPGKAMDSGLADETTYHYLVYCSFDPGDGGEAVLTPGVPAEATPQGRPDPVGDLSVRVVEEEVVCEWTPPAHGQCCIVRSAGRPALQEGQEIGSDQVGQYGQVMAPSAPGRLVDAAPSAYNACYSVFTVYGDKGVLGGSAFASVQSLHNFDAREKVRYRLGARRSRRGAKEVELRWEFSAPMSPCGGVRLVASRDEPPASPDALGSVLLFEWKPEGGAASGTHSAWVDLAPVARQNWAHFHCRLFLEGGTPSALVVHPDLSKPYLPDGRPAFGHPADLPRIYTGNVPKTVICPQCFDEFPVGSIRFTGDGVPTAVKGRKRIFSNGPPSPPTSDDGKRLTQKVCPRHEHALPVSAGLQENLIIGMIGAKGSGKSTFIASLIDRLAGQVGNDMLGSLVAVTDATTQTYREQFYNMLFEDRMEIDSNKVKTFDPLLYDLTISGVLWGSKRNRTVTLAFFDTAGESFDDPGFIRDTLQYLRVASGIMFLVDPLSVPAVRQKLPPEIPVPPEGLADPNDILSRVIGELENGRVLETNAPLLTPVAMVLTKCDVLRDLGFIEPNRVWHTDARHVGYFDQPLHEDMCGMMGHYLNRVSKAAYSTVRTRFPNHAFFGVSATGCHSKVRRYDYVEPWRVEDPLLWLLAQLKVIPTRARMIGR